MKENERKKKENQANGINIHSVKPISSAFNAEHNQFHLEAFTPFSFIQSAIPLIKSTLLMCHWQIEARYLHFVLNLLISMLFYHCPCYFYTIFHPNPLPQLLLTPSESYLIRKLIFLWLWTWQICFDCVSSGWRFLKQISVWKPLLQIHSNQRYYSQYYSCERSNFVIER